MIALVFNCVDLLANKICCAINVKWDMNSVDGDDISVEVNAEYVLCTGRLMAIAMLNNHIVHSSTRLENVVHGCTVPQPRSLS